jgi:hypothetical protein
MRLFGLENYCCNIETMTEDELYNLVLKALHNSAELKTYISQQLALVQEQLSDWTNYLRDEECNA